MSEPLTLKKRYCVILPKNVFSYGRAMQPEIGVGRCAGSVKFLNVF